jgi:hypothetical protein
MEPLLSSQRSVAWFGCLAGPRPRVASAISRISGRFDRSALGALGLQPSFRRRHWSNAGLHSPVPALVGRCSTIGPQSQGGVRWSLWSCMPARALARYDGGHVRFAAVCNLYTLKLSAWEVRNLMQHYKLIGREWEDVMGTRNDALEVYPNRPAPVVVGERWPAHGAQRHALGLSAI